MSIFNGIDFVWISEGELGDVSERLRGVRTEIARFVRRQRFVRAQKSLHGKQFQSLRYVTLIVFVDGITQWCITDIR